MHERIDEEGARTVDELDLDREWLAGPYACG
jgi:hypothetical protein